MKMKVSHIIAASKVFGKQEYASKPASIKLSLWFARNGKNTGEIAQTFVDASKAAFHNFAIRPEDGAELMVPKDKMPEYEAAINDLLNEEVELEVYKIKAEDFGDFEISPVDTFSILYAIEV